jgi:hypothetical protein
MPESLEAARFIAQAMDRARQRAWEDQRRIMELERLLEQARTFACLLEDEIAYCPHPTHQHRDAWHG